MPITPPALNQSIHVVPTFTLENGHLLRDLPVAYKTWGRLNDSRDNVMIICHAFVGNADVKDWWGELVGPGKAFDPSRFFIFCANVLGSPYGTGSPVTFNPDTGRLYGPEFPRTSIRDDVRLHKHVLDHLGISRVAVAIGGSMGGMTVLEWPLCSPPGYIRHIIPVATCAQLSVWCASWAETQRQCIYSDPVYDGGYYISQPSSGLSAAWMTTLLNNRTRDSFEIEFRGRLQVPPASGSDGHPRTRAIAPPTLPVTDQVLVVYNEGLQCASRPHPQTQSQTLSHSPVPEHAQHEPLPPPHLFSAQSYLCYQGTKFVARFDANCYIHLTHKVETHDLTRGRTAPVSSSTDTDGITTNPYLGVRLSQAQSSDLAAILATLPPRALVIGIETDGIFTPIEQRELATHIPDAELVFIPSREGHDGWHIESKVINGHICRFLRREFPEYYEGDESEEGALKDVLVKNTSPFNELEAEMTWVPQSHL